MQQLNFVLLLALTPARRQSKLFQLFPFLYALFFLKYQDASVKEFFFKNWFVFMCGK